MRSKLPTFLVLICFFQIAIDAFSQQKYPQSYIEEDGDGLLYDVSFQYKSHYISGLLGIKKESSGYHFVLLTKTGPTLMDFIITDQEIIWKKTIKGLDKRYLLKAMEKDFRTIALTTLENPKKIKQLKNNRFKVKKRIRILVTTSDESETVLSAKTKGFINPFKTFATYLYDGSDDIPHQIMVRHRLIKSKMELKRIEQ